MTSTKEEIETTLVDYFVIAGYDGEIGLVAENIFDGSQSNESNGFANDHRPPLQRSFVAKILHHFPQKRAGAPFSEEILSKIAYRILCMPKGLRFFTEKDVPSSPSIHTFANIREDGSRINGTALTFYELLSLLFLFYIAISIFRSKTLCLITRLPLVCATQAILRSLYEIVISSVQPPELPLESYIFWILNEIPLPSPGTTLKVIIISNALNYARLMIVGESLCSLAFPFRWQMVYVPILPFSQLKFVEAPVPYVMGWCYEDAVPESLFQSNVCVLDIDTGRIEFPEDLPLFPGSKQLCQEIKLAIERLFIKTFNKYLVNFSLFRYSIWEEPHSLLMDSSSVAIGSKPRLSAKGRRMDDWTTKRMSRSFDLDDGEDVFGIIFQVAEIARRAGVVVDVENIEQELTCSDQYANSPICRQYFQDARLNNAIRECVLNRIVCMLYSYEHFVVGGQGCTDKEMFEASRDSLVCFDKASFLSDQPDSHLAFLAAFLETQVVYSLIKMYMYFIFLKVIPQLLIIVLSKIRCSLRNLCISDILYTRMDITIMLISLLIIYAFILEELISKREETLDYVVPGPHPIAGAVPKRYDGVWPELNTALLEGSSGLSPAPSPWKQRYPRLRPKQHDVSNISCMFNIPKNIFNSIIVSEVKRKSTGYRKTKRMLVDKMGKEAVQLGHLDAGITGVEENTLVASFCDLLERIWAHGLIKKQVRQILFGKSALWSFVLQHQDLEKTGLSTRMSSSMLTPGRGMRASSLLSCEVPAPIILPSNENDISSALSDLVESIQRELSTKEDNDVPAWSRSILRAANFLCDKLSSTSMKEEYREPRGVLTSTFFSRNSSEEQAGYRVGSNTIKKATSVSDCSYKYLYIYIYIIMTIIHNRNVLRMTEIKTDIGYARAFVRLALERKLLHRHLATLLMNSKLLSDLYKQYAFTRCDDEKEQFLYHILSLNAAQFRCFTNTFTKTKMDYQVVIVTGGWRGSLPAVWVTVRHNLLFLKINNFKTRVLGAFFALKITRILVYFPRYELDMHLDLKNHPNGSLIILLVAEPMADEDGEVTVCPPGSPARGRRRTTSRSQTPQRERSPSLGRYNEGSVHRTHLLCGERGLVNAIEQLTAIVVNQAFQFGRYGSVWLFRQHYPWDYVGGYYKILFWKTTYTKYLFLKLEKTVDILVDQENYVVIVTMIFKIYFLSVWK
uniref:UDENN domain-containing protein n=1 Tax=Heterorhabditis bacteriophora TaxID=37862 RepID=A0A1I7X3X5_HETBA